MPAAKKLRASLLALPLALTGSVTARAEDLDTLVRLLLEKNPAIAAARRAVDARRARVPAARTLPEPNLSVQNMGNLLPPTLQAGDPSSARVVQFTQEIPFPGKLDLQGQIASAEADVELWKYEEVRREAVAELRMAYFDLHLARKTTEVVEKNRTLLQQFAEISEARYKVGQAAQQDVLKAQVEVSRLLDRLAVLRREAATAEVRINTLLYRAPDTPIGPAADLVRPKFGLGVEQLYEKALAHNPAVRMNRKEIDRTQLAVALAKKSFYPDFEVGFSYFNRRDLPEMYGVMFRAKIPLYFWRKQRPELESATSELIAQQRQYDSTLSTLYFRLKDPYLKTRADENLLDLYGEAIIPQATLALESSISSYRVGTVDFLSLLSNLGTLLEYEIKYYEVLADYYKALTVLESLSGEDLVH
jgi:cobalt-zinc-cadmium efflux system outer membrane protein